MAENNGISRTVGAVIIGRNEGARLIAALDAAQVQVDVMVYVDSGSTDDSLAEAAARGLGFAIVSWPLSKTWFESGQLVRVYDTEWVTDECFHLAHRPGEQERLDIGRTIDWMLQELRDDA